MGYMKNLAIEYAECIEDITDWDWEKCMKYVLENPYNDVRRFIEENM